MPSADFLNRTADAADFDAMTGHVTDPDVDAGVTVAAGGESQAITMGGAGVAGYDAGRYPATTGRDYTSPVTMPLTEAITYLGLWRGGVYQTRAKLRTPTGPGTQTVVAAVNVRTP